VKRMLILFAAIIIIPSLALDPWGPDVLISGPADGGGEEDSVGIGCSVDVSVPTYLSGPREDGSDEDCIGRG